jgi:hypothetical protein
MCFRFGTFVGWPSFGILMHASAQMVTADVPTSSINAAFLVFSDEVAAGANSHW